MMRYARLKALHFETKAILHDFNGYSFHSHQNAIDCRAKTARDHGSHVSHCGDAGFGHSRRIGKILLRSVCFLHARQHGLIIAIEGTIDSHIVDDQLLIHLNGGTYINASFMSLVRFSSRQILDVGHILHSIIVCECMFIAGRRLCAGKSQRMR